jgi:hypothetical protein
MYAGSQSFPKHLGWRGALIVAIGIFILAYPIYAWISTLVTGGVSRRGDLLVVDLKAMSNFQMDQNAGTTNDIPQRYRSLDGKRVLLTGQMWDPYEAGGQIQNFTLVYSIMNCCFNGPPKVQCLVQASVPPTRRAAFTNAFVNVIGTLHVGVQSAEGHVQSIYRMDVERVDPE